MTDRISTYPKTAIWAVKDHWSYDGLMAGWTRLFLDSFLVYTIWWLSTLKNKSTDKYVKNVGKKPVFWLIAGTWSESNSRCILPKVILLFSKSIDKRQQSQLPYLAIEFHSSEIRDVWSSYLSRESHQTFPPFYENQKSLYRPDPGHLIRGKK